MDGSCCSQPEPAPSAEPSQRSLITRTAAGGHPEYLKILGERWDLHIEKSGGYGTNADPMANFTAVAELSGLPRWLYPVLRTQEKLTRIMSLYHQGRLDEIDEELSDSSSCLDCALAMKREDSPRP